MSPASLAKLDFLSNKDLPRHVAIIMDGNRRWYKQHRDTCAETHISGHYYGVKVIPDILAFAMRLGIKVLTLYAFSTENFRRSEEEIHELFTLFYTQLDQQLPYLIKHEICLRCIGDLSKLPRVVEEKITHTVKMTASFSRLELVLAINYGAKDELIRAFKKLHRDILDQKISSEDLSESLISSYLDTSGLTDPDLLIRTGGEMRVSNFLLWQIAYTELYVTEVLWPDFKPQDLFDAIQAYQSRSRRGGK
ncbi:isoprenyl transferase [Candidatus Chlamydia sanziniae]|uniref:isoprenyl transferase n=1 Tax=Candidatus Chlamydia sanziniae TaxID=1806891 RepID=UPI000836DBC7|nr:isoprenyl transferase [Candidatus Chlamydia sanziniae]